MILYLKKRVWILFAILAAFSWALWGILTKFISADLSPFSYQILFTIGMLLSFPFVVRRCKRDEINFKGVAIALIASLLAIIGNISVYKSFIAGGQASVVLPLTNLYPLITILIALLIFKEKLHLMNGIGIMIVMPAIIILSGQSQIFIHPVDFFRGLGLKSWLLFALLSLVLFGIFSASQKVTTRHLSAEWSYLTFMTASVLISIGFIIFNLVNFNFSQKTFWVGSVAGMFDGLGVLAIYSAYRAKGKAAQVSSFTTSIQQVFTICLAIVFLKEKLTALEFIGIGLAILGSWFILYEKKESGL
jgi:uncharacterized membrane protein